MKIMKVHEREQLTKFEQPIRPLTLRVSALPEGGACLTLK
jgi:hypothetical protein